MNERPPAKIGALAREAEAHDHEAIAEMEAAQHPESDAGKLITPVEASRIRVRVLKSAMLDNEAATLAEQPMNGAAPPNPSALPSTVHPATAG